LLGREKMLYSGTKIKANSQKFYSEPFRRRENNSEFCSVEQKIGANIRKFVLKHFAEQNTLSILFARTGNFLFESVSQNGAAENFKNSDRKDYF
jgi:hypothetical protein